MRRMGWTVVLPLASLSFSVLLSSRPAEAIPAFARQVNAPCTMCHVAFPKLNAFGIMYKQNGYRMPGQEGSYLWTKKEFPFAGMFHVGYRRIDPDGPTVNQPGTRQYDLEELEFFSAGTVGPRLSYFTDIGSEESAAFEPGAAFLILDDLRPGAAANVKVGRYDAEFFFLSAARTLTLQPYLAPVSIEGFTGLEVNGYLPGPAVRYAVGTGRDETDETNPLSTNGPTAHDRSYYGWATYSVAGHTIGARYYAARADRCTPLPAIPPCAGIVTQTTHTQLDANLDLHFNWINLIFGAFRQHNIDGSPGNDQKNLLAELVLPLPAFPKVVVTGRLERQDLNASAQEDDIGLINTAYYFAPNARVAAEVARTNFNESGGSPDSDESRYRLALDFAF